MTPPNEPRLAIAATRETLEQFREFIQNALECVEVQEQHAGRLKAVQGAIKLLESEQEKTAKDLATEKETLAALRTVISAEQATHREQVASFQAELSEARNTIAEAQRVRKEFADLRKKYADVPAS